MHLKNLWNEKSVTLSFEVFPNKKDTDFESVRASADTERQVIEDLRPGICGQQNPCKQGKKN